MCFHASVSRQASCLIAAVTNDVVVVGYANQLHIRGLITPLFAIAKMVHLKRLTA